MANKRVPDAALPANFSNGQVLYGEDVNKIISVLREGVNANKVDLDKMLTGETSPNVVYSTAALYEIEDTTNGDVAFLYNPEHMGDGIKVYRYVLSSNDWIYLYDLSLITLYQLVSTMRHFYIGDEQPENWVLDDLWFDTTG